MWSILLMEPKHIYWYVEKINNFLTEYDLSVSCIFGDKLYRGILFLYHNSNQKSKGLVADNLSAAHN